MDEWVCDEHEAVGAGAPAQDEGGGWAEDGRDETQEGGGAKDDNEGKEGDDNEDEDEGSDGEADDGDEMGGPRTGGEPEVHFTHPSKERKFLLMRLHTGRAQGGGGASNCVL